MEGGGNYGRRDGRRTRHGYLTRAGAPGDQALLQRDGALLQSVAAGSVGIPPLKYNEFIKWIVFDFCEMLIISSLPWK